MEALSVECPVCHEPLLLEEDVLDRLDEGSLLECEVCHAVVEVAVLEPLTLRVVQAAGGFFVDCPRCETPIEVEGEGPITCPECGFTFKPDWGDFEEEEL